MRQRLRRLMSAATTVVGVSLAMATVAGQAPKPAQKGPTPKTSWGEPDLQGLLTDETQTPMQRPAKYAGRELLTDAEVAELDRVRATLSSFGDKRGEPGTEVDVAGAYNSVFTSRKHTGRRTSMVVDPPDGRIPPLTPAVQERNKEIREFQ